MNLKAKDILLYKTVISKKVKYARLLNNQYLDEIMWWHIGNRIVAARSWHARECILNGIRLYERN